MTMQMTQRTAKIYQFPVRGRTNSGNARSDVRVQANRTVADAPVIVYGGGWYHDAAIEDSRRPGKH
ncbi:DUF2735 domain-containing protein [Hansschlegelia quercus]|uniref:DUF2735 domain-containing protein n=1 Tax=Hansschlegelia quercus TaxID=2528245 RepID=A0A4V6MTJ4_9HYPH|nr:DUF2735 domain-containing protein [Hansschlegelia quercus]TBN51854.1 DUF2735 domain-containing protein [Hansschlegelia quercus]